MSNHMYRYLKICRNLLFLSLSVCWRWRFKGKRRILLVVFIVVLIFILTLTFFYFYYLTCSYSEVLDSVNVICDKYNQKESLGDLCYELCTRRSLVPNSCIPNHLGKDVVFLASYERQPVIVKTSNLKTTNLDQVFWTDKESNIFYPSLDHFYDMLRDSVIRNLNLSDNHEIEHGALLIRYLWTNNVQNLTYFSKPTQHVIMNNIWYLVQQPEYLLLKYYESKDLFPRIIGTCGHFYVEEFVQPLDNLFLVIYPVWRQKFSERAELALKIIRYLEKIESYFPKLQICDVKIGHFGLGRDGNVKLLDTDMVFYEPALRQNMKAIKNCTNDADCSFIDCLGYCESRTSECQLLAENSNFQRICINIFAGKFARKYFGLLGQSPAELSNRLQVLWQKCSQKMNSTVTRDVKEELKFLLLKAMKS